MYSFEEVSTKHMSNQVQPVIDVPEPCTPLKPAKRISFGLQDGDESPFKSNYDKKSSDEK